MDASADKPHILVVDDDTRLRELLKSFLSKNGFRVTAAGHAAEARQRLEALDFDLIVLERLAEVVVDAGLETGDAVLGLAHGR